MYAQPNSASNTRTTGPKLCLADEAPCPIETEEVRRRFDWRTLLVMPWHVVESLFWGVAASEPKYRQEVPVVIDEVAKARKSGGIMEVAR